MLKKKFSKKEPTAKVTFTLPKKAITNAKEVRVLGEFNNWDWNTAPVMKASKTTFTATIELNTGKEYQFRYLADNGTWENDWAADNYISAPYDVDNSVVVVPAVNRNGRAKADTTTAQKAASKKSTAKKVNTKKRAKADDLKKIEGIGPKIASLLNAVGIITFSNLSSTPVRTLKKVLTDAGSRFQMHNPKTWAAQAKLAAKGEWEKLKKWQDELKGGM